MIGYVFPAGCPTVYKAAGMTSVFEAVDAVLFIE